MKLKDIKLDRKEDSVIFKAILRCVKETKDFNKFRHRFSDINELINACYKSRRDHRNETFLTNIHYWPADTGMGLSAIGILLYAAILINNLKVEKSTDYKRYALFTTFVNSVNNYFRGAYPVNDVKDEYIPIIASAYAKCGNKSFECKKDDIEKILLNTRYAYSEKIPF